MENVGYASLQIIPSMKGFESKLTSGTSGPLSSAGAKGGRLFGNSAGSSMVSSVRAHAKTAALAGAAVFSAVSLAAFKLGKDSIAEAREAQKVGALTTAVIKSTGHAAGITSKQVGDMANRLSLVSGVDDEVIQRGENMLLTFKDIKNYVGGQYVGTFDEASAITLDMAAAMAGGKGGDLDLKSSSILVGKALNDPVKGLTALSRVGVSFTDQQKEQIKSLVESGDALSAQKIILGELKSEFGGAAAAQATMGEKVSVAWGNIEEQLGTALLPLVDRAERAFLNKGVPAVTGWASAFQKKGVPAIKGLVRTFKHEGIPALEDFYDQAKPVAEDVLPAIFDLLKAGKPILKASAGLVGDLAGAFTKIPHWAQVAIAGGLLAGKAGGFKIAGSLISGKGGLLGGVSKASPLPVYVVNSLPGAGGTGAPVGAAGGGKLATAAKLTLVGAAVYFGGKAFKDSGAPQAISQKIFGTDENGLGKAIDGGREGLKAYAAQMKDTAAYWHTFEFKADGAFNGVEKAIANSQNHVKQYQRVLGQTPKQVATTFQINGIDRAVAQADTLINRLRAAADVARGLDNGVTYQHGGQSPDARTSAHFGDRSG